MAGNKPTLTKSQSRVIRDNPDAARLFAKVVDGSHGCWNWTASSTDGYGTIFFRGRSWRAHRVSYTIFCGEIPDGLLVCHHCDNPACINPSHLFLGHASANMKDMVRKGRARALIDGSQSHFKSGHAPRGEDGSGAKLTEQDALKVIELAAAGEFTKNIASKFGLRRETVQMILRGQTWKHLPRPAK